MIFDNVKKQLVEEGASLVGFADIRTIVQYDYAISIAVALDPVVLSGITDNPTKEYEAEYNRVNAKLDALSYSGEKILRDAGFRSEAVTATVHDYDQEALSYWFQHKTSAVRSGLGWIGKLDLLVTKEFGSGIRLATVLTDAPLGEPAPFAQTSDCGDCSACADVCPANASKRVNWKVGMKREDLVDIIKCNASIEKRKKELELDRSICGVCVVVCPWTKAYMKS